MERILNEDEKIRRAEEIYFRRNNKNINLSNQNENKRNLGRYFGNKIALNLLLLFNITILILCIQYKDYIFKEEFLNKCSQYNLNISNSVNEILEKFLNENSGIVTNENIIQENQTDINENQTFEENKDENINQDNQNTSGQENTTESQISSINQMDLDVENLRKSYSFVKPITGIVSSGFGSRESEYQNVTGYHTGVDIAAEKGTDIIASTEGIVTLVSSEGDYRKSCENKTK